MSTTKPRPYLRSCRNLNQFRRERPRYRLVKIDTDDRPRQITLDLVNESSLDAAIRAFLTPPPAVSQLPTLNQHTNDPDTLL